MVDFIKLLEDRKRLKDLKAEHIKTGVDMSFEDQKWNEIQGGNGNGTKWAGEFEGDYIQGVVEKFETVETKDGREAPVMEIFNSEEQLSYTVWPKKQLMQLLTRGQVKVGSTIKIIFEGMIPLTTDPTKTFRKYKLFTI
jgi:hypothetical protein